MIAKDGPHRIDESTTSRWFPNARTELQARLDAEARTLVTDDVAVAEPLGAMQSRFGQGLQQLFVSQLADPTEA